jgi:hypothetical protein
MKLFKNILLWVLAVVLMASFAIYQRMTGPTYPVRGEVKVENSIIEYKFPRSSDESGEDFIKVDVPDGFQGQIKYRRFKSHDEWHIEDMEYRDGKIIGDIPTLPAAGKVMYQVFTGKDKDNLVPLTKEPVILRYKGKVPDYILFPHIFFMFLAMVISTRTMIEALLNRKRVYLYTLLTTIFFFIGGLILGPIVQKFAFDAYWTGWPFGHDLTDNKTIIAFIMWIIATIRLRTKPNARGWAIAAGLVLLAVYLIPHSVLGSEIDFREIENMPPK